MLKIKLKTFWDVLQQHHAKKFNSKREIKLKSRHTAKILNDLKKSSKGIQAHEEFNQDSMLQRTMSATITY